VAAQSSKAPLRHMQNTKLPISQTASSPQQSLPARYDLQIGMTFTQDFASLAYNITAVAQADPDGYGPAYLLNGLTDAGYWYQVGISYNWPFAMGGYTQGFGFNYEVFAPNQTSVYPEYGGGGMSAFSGPVNSGDIILLNLQLQDDLVFMYARDYNTGAFAIEAYDAFGAQYFQGSPYGPSDMNGYFTGLMTEWYHAVPEYRDGSKVTYSNYNFALSSAWIWMDQFDPYNPYWDGAWLTATPGPTDFTKNATQIHTFTFDGARATSNAYQFTTGTVEQLSTSITLLPADQSTALSASNQFQITFILNGKLQTAYAKNGTTTIDADNGTQITISGTSTDSTPNEAWSLNSQLTNVTIPSGTNSTFYYYDTLAQLTSFIVANGGNSPNATITYYAAPYVASNKLTLTRIDLPLVQSTYQRILVAKGTTVSLSNPISGSPAEQWVTTSSTTWTVQTPNQIPARIIYNHQFLLTAAGAQQNWQWVNSGTTAEFTVPSVSSRVLGTGQRVNSYTIDAGAPTMVQPTLGTVTISVFMNSPHQVTVNQIKQFQVSVDVSLSSIVYMTPSTISGDYYWYDQGTAVNIVFKSVLNRGVDAGERLQSFTVNGAQNNISAATPVSALNLGGISSSIAVTQTTVKQFKLIIATGSLSSVTEPSLVGDVGWYDAGTQVTATFDYSWNQTGLSRTNAVSYRINHDSAIALPRSPNRTFQANIAMTEPKTLSISSANQYALKFTGGFNTAVLQASPTKDAFYDVGTNVIVTTDSASEPINGNTRRSVAGCILDGAAVNMTRGDAGLFSPQITMNSAHELAFREVTQYLVTFKLYDSTGNRRIVPDLLQVQTSQNSIIAVSNLATWMDSATAFQIVTVMWQRANVNPNTAEAFTVYAPREESVNCRIFGAQVLARDFLGLPLGDAQVSATLINGTTVQAMADAQGNAYFPMVPLGNVHAKVTYLGLAASTDFNAETQPSATLTVFASYATLIAIAFAAVALIVAASAAIMITQKKRRQTKTKTL
jgi:hypothetical protein